MGATSDDLMEIARQGASGSICRPSGCDIQCFGDIEEQCAAEYGELLNALRDDELFAPADLQRQEELVEQLKPMIGSQNEALLEELVDNTARQLWMNQEAAFHLGMAVGLRLAQGRRH